MWELPVMGFFEMREKRVSGCSVRRAVGNGNDWNRRETG